MLWHPANPDAVTACVARARENARGVREQISSEMWELLNRLHLLVSRTRPAAVLASPHEFFVRIREASHAFQGVMKATLPRGEAYEFLELGAHLERADTTARLLSVKVPGLQAAEPAAVTNERLSSLLKSCGAFEAFRKQESDELRAGARRRVPAARAQPAARGLLLPRAVPELDPGDLGRRRCGPSARSAASSPSSRSPTCTTLDASTELLLERVMRGLADAAEEIAAELLHDARRSRPAPTPSNSSSNSMFLRVEHTTEFALRRARSPRPTPSCACARSRAAASTARRSGSRPSRSACACASTATTSATTSTTSTCSSRTTGSR